MLSTGIDPASILATAKKVETGLKWGEKLFRIVKKLRYPKPKRGAEGIIIAFDAEDEPVYRQIKNDLIYTLRKLAATGNQKPFEIIELPSYHIEKINEPEDAVRILHKCASKLIFWGPAKKRTLDGKVTTVLEMNAYVSHGLITTDVSEVFAQEMRELLPERLLATKDNDLIEMEINAVGLDLAVHYILAVASFFTDVPFSLELFRRLQKKLEAYDTSALPLGLRNHINILKKKAPISIVYCLLRLSKEEHMKWRKNKDDLVALKTSYEYVLEADNIIPDLYQTAITASIYYFVVEGDARRARKFLERWPAVDDATWAFNMAFLHAFDGNLAAATRFYKVGSRRETNSQVQFEIEEFLEWILAKYPQKYELHYCVGMFQLFNLGNKEIADSHFKKFLESVPSGEYLSQVKEVERFLEPSFKLPKAKLK